MFLSNEEYAHVTGLLDGTIGKTPLLEELAGWAKRELGVDVYVYAYFCVMTFTRNIDDFLNIFAACAI